MEYLTFINLKKKRNRVLIELKFFCLQQKPLIIFFYLYSVNCDTKYVVLIFLIIRENLDFIFFILPDVASDQRLLRVNIIFINININKYNDNYLI